MHVIPISKIPTGVKIAYEDGFDELGRRIISYYSKCNKPDLEPHLQMLQKREDLVVVEIGVWKGDNAERLCEELDIKKMYLIDPYDKYEEWDFPNANNDISKAETEARDKLSEYDFITWIRDHSDNAVTEIEDEIDYVYIDGNHSYDFVKSDLDNYYELLADDGVIAGDDIHFSGVAQAVSEFAVERNLQPHFEKEFPDWYFINNRRPDPSVDYMFTPEDVHAALSERY